MQGHQEHGRSTRYTLIALIFFGNILSYVDRQVLALLKPTLVAEFGWTDAQFAHLGSVFTLVMAGSVLFAGLIVDKFGVRIAYGAAVGLWSLAGMAHAAASSVGQFVLARAALAATESVGGPATVKASAQYLPLKERSVGLGIISMAPNIGAVIAPLVVPLVAVTWGWKSAFLITGGLGFVWLVFWFRSTRALAPSQETGTAAPSEPIAWGELLRDKRTWAITLTKALADMVFWFMLFWIPDLFSKVFQLGQAQIAGPIALAYTMAALGALAAGVGQTTGWESPEFAIATIFAIIVMYDAAGVRQAAGRGRAVHRHPAAALRALPVRGVCAWLRATTNNCPHAGCRGRDRVRGSSLSHCPGSSGRGSR